MSWKGELMKAGIFVDGSGVNIPGLLSNIGQGKSAYLSGIGVATNSGTSPTAPLLTLAAAKAKMRTGKNDTTKVIASTTAVNMSATLDWNLNMCHMIGLGSFGRMNMRSRINQNAAFTPMLTISGYGNSFQNLYFMQGYSGAADLVGLSITGQRNSFINCHVLPQNTSSMITNFHLVSIDASEQYFYGCVIGGDGATIAAGDLLQIGATSDGGPPRCVFENCIFLMRASASAPYFINAALAGMGEGAGIFLNCHFINIGTTLTCGINGAGLNNFKLYFDNRCNFVGVTDIVTETDEASVFVGAATGTATAIGKAVNPD